MLLTVTADNQRIDITWNNPEDEDFDNVLITWTPDGTTGQVVGTPAASCSATGLINNTEYTFTLVSVDASGNSAPPLTFTATPSISGPVTYDSLYTAADLDAVRHGLDGHYILMTDLDIAPEFGGGWQPIGTPADPFLGILDGNGHDISGLYIDSGADYSGLFGYTGEDSTIKNLGVDNCDVTGKNFTGGLVGYNYRGTINSCHSSGVVDGGTGVFVGGLIGINSQGPVALCFSTVDVVGNQSVGGLIGRNNNAGVTQCYATGAVTASGGYAGGLLGYSNTHTLADCFATGDVNGLSNVGGLAGYLSWVTANNCYSAGTVNGSSVTGGLVGSIADTTINHCYYDRDTSGQNDTTKGEPRTTDQMKLIDTSVPTYEGWNFTDIWNCDAEYPFLLTPPLP